MCFSAAASFIASGTTGALGVATLWHTRAAREVPLASTPLLFGVQQFIEGRASGPLTEAETNLEPQIEESEARGPRLEA